MKEYKLLESYLQELSPATIASASETRGVQSDMLKGIIETIKSTSDKDLLGILDAGIQQLEQTLQNPMITKNQRIQIMRIIKQSKEQKSAGGAEAKRIMIAGQQNIKLLANELHLKSIGKGTPGKLREIKKQLFADAKIKQSNISRLSRVINMLKKNKLALGIGTGVAALGTGAVLLARKRNQDQEAMANEEI